MSGKPGRAIKRVVELKFVVPYEPQKISNIQIIDNLILKATEMG